MKHLCVISLNLDQWSRGCLKIFLFLALVAIFFLGGGGGARAGIFDSFGRGSYEEHLGEIILNFGPTIQKMPFKDFFIFISRLFCSAVVEQF